MELLLSNLLPLKTSNRRFADCFETAFTNCDTLKIATGYISTESITELKKIVEMNEKSNLELLIGMHYFDGITKPQYDAVMYLDDFLRSKGLKGVRIATVLKFHGKLYSFQKEGEFLGSIIGSSNLSSILGHHRNYEADVFMEDVEFTKGVDSFIEQAFSSIASPFSEWKPSSFLTSNPLLDDIQGAGKVSNEDIKECFASQTSTTFNIPLKSAEDAPKSNLNVYFGKGRENMDTGLIKPRHWYEVELIVPREITDSPEYPKKENSNNIFKVVTDDGWTFTCKTSGDYSKNLRSQDDLKILGKWIKGRLENHNVLKVGEPVTQEVLNAYGRDSFKLIKTKKEGVWLIDFSLPNS